LKTVSRRRFLADAGKASALAYPAMLAWDMLRPAPAHPFELEGTANGKKVIILGAGLAGMASAYELSKLGYQCTILEARERSGGRCWSVRKGAVNTETDLGKHSAGFDDGLYFNAGPSRIPHNHELTLHYCKELGVPLQVYNNVNEAAWYFSEGKGNLSNKKVRVREIHNDMRGYTMELLAKAIDTAKLDTGLTAEDNQKLLEYLRAEGGLDIDKLYKVSSRRGYTEMPGSGDRSGKIADAHKLADIIGSGLLDPDFYNVAEYTFELQMTMLQAIGGMDQIGKAFEQKISKQIRFNCQVTAIHNQAEGVEITYRDMQGEKKITADLCICTIPLPVLSNINHNFGSDASRAIDFIGYNSTGKIGLQFKRRFWEEDEHIYGGITHTNNELTQIFYPSNDYLGKKGVLIGYYNFNEKAKATGELSYAEREKLALTKGALIHSQYPKEFERSFSVSWHKTQFSMGGWAVYNNQERQTYYKALQQPDKQVYFAGEHMTHLNAWMAGAFESARKTVADIHARVMGQRVAYAGEG
jgi:monoamine oxidase